MGIFSVIIATPDPLSRRAISGSIERLPDFEVVAQTRDLMDTYVEVESKGPNIVLIAESLTEQPEFEVMHALFSTLDVRWLVLKEHKRAAHAMFMARQKKSDLFELPHGATASCLAAQLRSITHSPAQPLPASKAVTAPAIGSGAPDHIVLIGSSTGGVDALMTILQNFPADCPPTVIVQHTGSGFGQSLSLLLDRHCRASVRLVDGRLPLKRGEVLIGAGNKSHVRLSNANGLSVEQGESASVNGHVPSVDVLFKSAVPFAERVNAAVLTGMGKDGASGLLELRKSGAHTIAQDKATSVVFGMPKAAIDCGAADSVLPLAEISHALLAPARGRRQKKRFA